MSSSESRSPDIIWQEGQVCTTDRYALFGQCPITIRLTGLSASGKSSLAFALERRLVDRGHACYVLDGDNVRQGLNKDLRFSHQDRTENIRRIAEVAHLMNDAGLIVITAFISPYSDDRQLAREVIGGDRFLEVYVNTPLEICEARDPKGFYRRARAGQLSEFTGVDDPYEPPRTPALIIDTSNASPSECAGILLSEVLARIGVPEVRQTPRPNVLHER